jgi:hypothetical protein
MSAFCPVTWIVDKRDKIETECRKNFNFFRLYVTIKTFQQTVRCEKDYGDTQRKSPVWQYISAYQPEI